MSLFRKTKRALAYEVGKSFLLLEQVHEKVTEKSAKPETSQSSC
jgi:hypothetical protein